MKVQRTWLHDLWINENTCYQSGGYSGTDRLRSCDHMSSRIFREFLF